MRTTSVHSICKFAAVERYWPSFADNFPISSLSHNFAMSGKEGVMDEEIKVQPNWHAMTKAECLSTLELPENHRAKGLTTEQAAARLEKYGRNMLSGKEKKTLLMRILNWKRLEILLILSAEQWILRNF